MEPFSISCTTCGVRLKIRKRVAIGQILACPKCGSMNLIERPPEDLEPTDVSPPLLPTDEWESQQSRGRRQFALVFMACIIGMGAAVSGAAWLLMGAFADSPGSVPAVATVESVVADHGPASAVDDVQSMVTPRSAPVGDSATSESVAKDVAIDSTDSTQQPAASTPSPLKIDTPTVESAAVESAAVESAAVESAAARTGLAATESSPVASARPVRDAFGEMTVDYDAVPASSDGVSSHASIDVVRSPSADVQVRRSVPQPVQPQVARVNVDQRLQDPIPRLTLPPTPLARFLRWVGKFSTIPITVDPLALQQTGSSMETSISFEGSDLTVGKLLRDALVPHQLGYLVEDGQLVIVAASATDASLRTRRYDVADLLGPRGDGLAPLASLVERMVAPSSWKRHGGLGAIGGEQQRLVVSQSVAAHFEILIFVEKLRVARGLRVRSRYPAEFFAQATRRERAAPALRKPVDAQFLRPTSLRQIIDDLAGQADLQLLVDWRALAAAGWSDQVAVSFDLPRGTLEEALQRLLETMDLTYRMIDGRTIQVTTGVAELAAFDLEAYPIGDLMTRGWDRDRILEAVQMQFGSDRFTPQGGGALTVDVASETLFVRLPQSQQMLLQAALDSLRNS